MTDIVRSSRCHRVMNHARSGVLVVALTLVGSQAYAQDLGYIFVESPTLHPTIVKVPDDFDRNRTYSVVVGLHGFGATPESFLGTTFDIANEGFILASVPVPPQRHVEGLRLELSLPGPSGPFPARHATQH